MHGRIGADRPVARNLFERKLFVGLGAPGSPAPTHHAREEFRVHNARGSRLENQVGTGESRLRTVGVCQAPPRAVRNATSIERLGDASEAGDAARRVGPNDRQHIGAKLIGRDTVRHMRNSGRDDQTTTPFEGLGKVLRLGV